MGSRLVPHFDGPQIAQLCPLPQLIESLGSAFSLNREQPVRQLISIDVNKDFLVMPATSESGYFGAKLISVFEDNPNNNFPAIQGVYCLFEGESGSLAATFDAGELTARRTAAASALAAMHLSNPGAKNLTILGTGNLAPYFAEAHSCFRDIETIAIWGRDYSKADRLARTISLGTGLAVRAEKSVSNAIKEADIISTLTSASKPILYGTKLRPGVHLDLVGSHKPNMREADIECFAVSKVFVDTYPGATTEAGCLIAAREVLPSGKDLIASDLSSLTNGTHPGRTTEDEITLFKSVGCSMEDLVAATIVYESVREH